MAAKAVRRRAIIADRLRRTLTIADRIPRFEP
jgi:hypothetical protein